MQTPDLNLLAALDALLKEESVTGAARRLQLSPAAMSRTLGRIRDAVGDPILVRAGKKLVSTPRAREMRDSVRAALDRATELLRPEEAVALSTVERVLSIRTSDFTAPAITNGLVRIASVEAPKITLRFLSAGQENVAALRDGGVDVDIGDVEHLAPEMKTQSLYRDKFVCVLRSQSPLAKQKLTIRRYADARHVTVSRRSITRGPVDEVLATRSLSRQIATVVPNYLAAAALVAESDLVALMPERTALGLAGRFGLSVVATPFGTEPLPIAQAWHPRFDTDPVHAWLRRRVRDAARSK